MEQIDERIAKAKEEARREALEEVRAREAAEQPSSSLASATYGVGNSSSDDDLPDFYSSILADLDDEEEEPVVQRRSYGDSEDGDVELPDEIYDFSDLDAEDEDPEDDGMYNGDDSDEDSDSDDSEGEDDFDSSDFFSDSDFEDDDDSDDDGEDSHFDIMALLEERASRGDAEEAEEEKIPNPMLTMKEDNVAVVEINLDMLTEYIKSQKGNQRI
jgi:ribonuclease E